MANGKAKTRNAKKHLREETKMEIVHDYYLGALNKTHLAEKYGVGWETVHKIIRKFAAENDKSALLMGKHTTDSLSEENKALRKEVLELKKRLYDETMRADFYDTMIDVAEEMFGIEIRKKAGTGQGDRRMRQEGTEECDKRERKDETGGDGRRKREGRKSCKGIGCRRRDLTIIKLIRQPRGGTRRVVPS